MAETYCGKTCAECALKETLNCPGCKAGPGQVGGECELAKCCRSKGHKLCDSCDFQIRCGTFRSRARIPEYRRQLAEAQAEQEAAIAARAPKLSKLLHILFWLIIPDTIAGLLINGTVSQWLPGLYTPGLILSAVCLFAYGVILLILTSEDSRYRTAGICMLISGAATFLPSFTPANGADSTLAMLASVFALISSLVGEYHECMAHSAILTGADNVLSDKWTALWKWYIGMYAAMFGSILVMLFSAALGLLVLLAALLGVLVVSILKLVYLYQTARTFRAYL